MKVKSALLPFFCLLLPLCSSLYGQAPNSLAGQTITLNYQSTSGEAESGTAVFKLFENNKAWEYGSDDGEWESAIYDWTPEGDVGNFTIMWGEGEYVDISLTFTTSQSGSFTYTSWEIDDTGISAIENEGIGNFVLSTTSVSDEPPFERYFSEDFTNPSLTRENFHLGDGDQSQGITFEHNSSGFYTIRGLFTGEEGEDDPYDRWFEVSAKSLLPMNKSWIVEADLVLDSFSFTASLPHYAHCLLQLEFDSVAFGLFQIGRRIDYNNPGNSSFANVYYDPNNNDSVNGEGASIGWSPSINGNVTYRIINNADDYTLIFQYTEHHDWPNTLGSYETTKTVMELEWDDGSYVTYDPMYSWGWGQWRQIENWTSIGDQYVQPSMAFELPHTWSSGHGSDLSLIELEGGEMIFSSFSVQPDREIIDFDDGDDLPTFYNKLATEVGQGGFDSRYHLLKGLHELAQLVESTDSESLKQFAVSFGVEDSILDFSLADSPLAGTYEFELNREFHIGKLTAFAQNSLIPQLESIDNHFAQVTDVVTMETSMTGAEEEIIADATDVKVLRAMVNLLASLASLQSGYDWDLSVGYLQDLDMEVTETDLEEFRQKHPGFLGVRSVEQLRNAKAFLQTAISVYKEASSGLRADGRFATQTDWFDNTEPDFLFVLDEWDFAEESEFIADLEELHDALSNDYEITDDEEYSGTIISLNAFFNGGLDIPKLLPESVGDQFVSGDLKDPTLGGILPGMSYDSGLVVQDLRRAFYDEELVYGYERHDSREEALQDFDYLAYLDLNPDLGGWYQTEVNARNHFYNRGFWDERRYFYYPYELGEQPPNHAADSLAGHKATSIGIIPELNNYQFSYVYYFINDVSVIVKDEIENTWEKNHYIYRRTGFYSAELVLIPENATQGEKIITSMSFTSSERQGTDGHKESGDIVVSIPSPVGEILQGNGAWECWHLDDSMIESEIPWEYRPDQGLDLDYAPYAMEGAGHESVNIQFTSLYGGDSLYFQSSTYGPDTTYYQKDGKNLGKISKVWSDWDWQTQSYQDRERFLYHLNFTGENNGTFVKYSEYVTENRTQVDSGDFTISGLSATSIFAWEPYDNFENGTLDEGKWETGYFSGGEEPKFISDNYSWPPQNILELKGDSYSGSNARKIPAGSFWEEVDAASQSAGDSNTAIFIQDEEIIGVQAKIKLNEYTYSENGYSEQFSNQAGVYIAAPPSQLSIELVWREYQDLQSEWGGTTHGDTYFSYYVDANLSDPTNGKMAATRNQWYTVSLIRLDGKISYFISGRKVSEFAAGDDLPLQWIIGAFNDNGQPFSAYVDDIRVLKRSDIGPGEPHLVVDEIEAQRDLVYLQTQKGPVLSAGDGEINFEIFLPQQPQFTAAVLEVDGVSYDLTQDEAPEGFRTRYGYGRGEINELYDIESSSANDWSTYANGKAFNFKLTHDGVDYNYSHYLPGESALPPAPNISINGDATWTTDPEEGHDYLKLIPAENVVVSWDLYQAADSEHEHIYIGLTEWVGEDDENDVLEEVFNADATSFEFSRDLLKAGRQYSLYVEFVNLTEAIDPEGFKRAHQGDDWPILSSYASSITALDMEIVGDSHGPLDGSIISIQTDFDDAVTQPSLTLAFENGKVTSTWENPDDNEYEVVIDNYNFEELSTTSFKITAEEGDVLTFDTKTGVGSLIDYDSNGQIDQSGSWDFTFIMHEWEEYDDFSDNYLDGEKWITSNQFFQGNVPVETNQEIRLEGHTPNNPSDASFLILNNLNNVFGVEADIWLPENAPVETAVLIGIAAEGTPLGSLDLWNDIDNPRMYIDLNNFETNEAISYSRNATLGTKYKVGIIEDNGKTKLFLNGEKVAEVTTTHSENINILFRGESDATVAEPYSAYLDNVRVLRREHTAEEGAPIYLLDDNQFMYLTGMAWSETEAKAPDALIFDKFVGHFAIVPNPYFGEEPNGDDLTVMPLHSHLLLPVIQQADGDWVEELSDFDGFGSLHGPEYVETEFGLSAVGYLRDGNPEPEFVEKIFVSGGSFDFPHYSFHDSHGTQLDMEKFVFQADKTYRFVADGMSPSHPFTLGASIQNSGIIKITKISQPDLPKLEEHNFTGVTDDLEVLGNDLLMPPIEEGFGDDYVLSLNGDYFDFQYSKDLLPVFKEHDVKLHYLCDFHSTMNGLLHLPIEEVVDFVEIFVSGGSMSYPYYTFSDEEGPIDLATYDFGAGENYRFTAVDGFTPHNFNIGPVHGVPSSYATGGPLAAIGDEMTLSVPSDFSNAGESLYFYCVAHSATMNGQLNVVEAAPNDYDFVSSMIRWKEFDILDDGTEIEYPWQEGKFTETHFERLDPETLFPLKDPYFYKKTGPNTFTLVLDQTARENGSTYTLSGIYKNRYEGYGDSVSVSDSGTYKGRLIFEVIDEISNTIEQYPVVWLTPEIFSSVTGNLWEWTSFANFNDPELGQGGYFALAYDLIFVSELIESSPDSKKSVWLDEGLERYQYFYFSDDLINQYNLTIEGYYQPPRIEDLMAKVEGFLEDFRNGDQGYLIDSWVTIYNAEKVSDVLDPDRCVYIAELSNDISIIFNQDGEFVHSSPTFWDNEYKTDYIPEELEIAVRAELPGSRILELWEEISHLDGTGFIYRAVVESNSSEFYEIYLNNYADKIHLVSRFYGEIQRDFPMPARDYMEANYKWDDGEPMYYSWWYDEPSGDYYAQLDDGTLVIFDVDGNFEKEVPPVVPETGLSFNPSRSAWGSDLLNSNFIDSATNGQNPAFIHIKKLKSEEFSPNRRNGLIADHDPARDYPESSLVIHEGVSYISQQYVPVGTPITSTQYWTSLESTSPTENPGEPPADEPDYQDISGINPPVEGEQNQPPQISESHFEVTENAYIGTHIGQVIASDPDGNGSLSYSLHLGVESMSLIDMNQDGYLDLIIEQPEGVFSTILNESGTFQTIDQLYPHTENTGELSANHLFTIDQYGNLFTAGDIDYEALGGEISLGVSVSDGDGGVTYKKFAVSILDEDDGGTMPPPYAVYEGDIFQISLTKSLLDKNDDVQFADLELGSTDLPAETPLKLTFDYFEGDAPRYIIVSGANVRGFKHIYPEWDYWLGQQRPGSFTILAETVDPVNSSDGDLNSTFGMLVAMGGDRYYHGAIFEANVPILDLGPAEISDPWSSAAFSVAGKWGEDTQVRAFLPRTLLDGQLGVPEFYRLKAGLAYQDGDFQFINGSFPNATNGTGADFYRLFHQGLDIWFPTPVPYGEESANHSVGDSSSDGDFIQAVSVIDDFTKFSKFDFNGDGHGDDLLEVGFNAEKFPAEVQFGDFYIEEVIEYAGLISGKVVDAETGVGLSDFGIWPFTAPYGIDGPRESNFEFDLQQELWEASGKFSIKLPAGEYYFEAWGYDENSSSYYTSTVIDDNGSPFVITEDDNTSYEDLVVELRKEFMPVYVSVSSKLIIEGDQDSYFSGAEIQLYLVDDNDKRIYDYPHGWLWVQPDGSIFGEAPVGKYEVVLQSWDNSIKLSNPPVYWEVSDLGYEQTLPNLYATQASRIKVSGTVRDAVTGSGIWADIVFVDPNDENIYYWPQWEPIYESSNEGEDAYMFDVPITINHGEYAVSIPAGTYKIKAIVWDGIYESEYYISPGVGTTDFNGAEDINVTQNLTGIDFNLDSAPSAQINVSVLEQDTNLSIPYAWFDFFDGYDEYGPVFFPQVDYSNSAEGNYSLKITAGSYKVLIGSPDHDPVYLKTDIQGNYYWEQGWDWTSAALLELSNTDNISLPIAKLQSFGPPPPPPGGNSISGKVLTRTGIEVPKADVIAYTDDWIYWFTTTSKGNGGFEFEGLPEGNWIVYACPPYDSEEFSGSRCSVENWDNPIYLEGNTDKNVTLRLEGSNVFGRILYPKKNDDDTSKLEPLSNAFIWAFQDENQTGEPNYNDYVEGETFIYNEAYVETNEDGYFSLFLPEAGKYSMRVDLPWFMASMEFAPLHFELRNKDQELVLGNTIRLDWKKAKIQSSTTSFTIERKSSTQSSFRNLDSNLSKSSKSYLDTTVEPGKSYEYRVYEISNNGDKDQLSASDVKVSKPFIYLAPSEKIIQGEVNDQSDAPVVGAEVVAWQLDGDGYANTFTENSGQYELIVGPGKWEVMVYPAIDTSVDWNYNGGPKLVNFANNSSKPKTVKFEVERLSSNRGVIGQIIIPQGKENALSSIYVDVFKTDGTGNWANPLSDGNFSVALDPGRYELSVWLDPADFAGYEAPEPQWVRVGKGLTDVGIIEIKETSINSGITGVVTSDEDNPKPLANFEVWAWSESGGWAYTHTDVNGSYVLNISPGLWEVGIEAPLPPDGSQSPYLPVPIKRLRIVDSIKTLDFVVSKAGIDVEGVVNNSKGTPVLDSGAWVYAFTQNGDDYEFLTEMPVSSRGTFKFPSKPGTYSVGLWIPPGSDYIDPPEQVITVESGSTPDKIKFVLEKANAIVSGKLIDKESNASIENLVGEVYAMRIGGDGDGWRSTEIESNGTYSLILSPGTWLLDFYIAYDEQKRKYPRGASSPIEVSVSNGIVTEQNFVLTSASASITGKVIYADSNASVTDHVTYIWAYREGDSVNSEYWQETETDENGTFTLPVLRGGVYEIGTYISPDLWDAGYLNPSNKLVKMDSNNKSVSFSLVKPSVENFISGTVVDDSQNSLAGAYIYAWTYDGLEVSSVADENGDFNITVANGKVWNVGAEYSVFDDDGEEIIYLPTFEKTIDLVDSNFATGIKLVLQKPEFKVPDGVSVSFDPTKDFVTTLPDGTEITIPAGAVNVPTGQSMVRLVVSPSAKGLDKSGNAKPADYAYQLELFDEKGKEIEGVFKKDIIIKVNVDVDSFVKKGIDLNTIEGMYYSTTKQKWEKVKTSTWDAETQKLTMTTDHFTGVTSGGKTAKTDLAKDSTTLGDNTGWHDSSWFGQFYDPLLTGTSNNIKWVYSGDEQLGWLAVSPKQTDDSYWFFHSSLGWIWFNKDHFDVDVYDKSHFYSAEKGAWLFLHPQNGIWDFSANNGNGGYL